MAGARTRSGNTKVGRMGEDIACEFLMGEGHTVIGRNWRRGHFEIDIITIDRIGIHFVEVKTRRPPVQAAPQDCVNPAKQRRIIQAAQGWKARNGYADAECHFDIVSVIISAEGTYTEYYPDAFIPAFV
ncbi:MAG: YraN family protein [Candidatus Cryptobacteroides sp.]